MLFLAKFIAMPAMLHTLLHKSYRSIEHCTLDHGTPVHMRITPGLVRDMSVIRAGSIFSTPAHSITTEE